MAYPPPLPPTTRTDSTISAGNHAQDHNKLAAALRDVIEVLGADPSGGYASLSERLLAVVAGADPNAVQAFNDALAAAVAITGIDDTDAAVAALIGTVAGPNTQAALDVAIDTGVTVAQRVKFAAADEVAGVSVMGFDAATDTLYGVQESAPSTLMRCTDPTLRSWETLSTITATAGATTRIRNVFITAAGTLIVNIGTTTTNQWMRSTDGGATWTPVITDPIASTLRHSMAQGTDGTILYGTYYSAGTGPYTLSLYKSTDDGATWTVTHTWPNSGAASSYPYRHIHLVQADPYVEGRFWISSGDWDNQSHVWYTDDAGENLTLFGSGAQRWRAVTMLFTEDEVIIGQDGDEPITGQAASIIAYDRVTKVPRVIFDSSELSARGNRAGALYYGALAPDGNTFIWSSSDYYPAHVFAGTLDGTIPTAEIESLPLAEDAIRVNTFIYGPDSSGSIYLTTTQEGEDGDSSVTRRGTLIQTALSDPRAIRDTTKAKARSIATVGAPFALPSTTTITLPAGRVYASKIQAASEPMRPWVVTFRNGATVAGNIRFAIAACNPNGSVGKVLTMTPSTAVDAAGSVQKILFSAPGFMAAGTEYWLLMQSSAITTIVGLDTQTSLGQLSRVISSGITYPFDKSTVFTGWVNSGITPAVVLTDG